MFELNPIQVVQVLSTLITSFAVILGLGIAIRWLRLRKQEVEGPRDLGPVGGGYIVVNLPEKLKPLFHDLLKGFEEYAELKGYEVKFSVDNTLEEKIAFKFTVSKPGVSVSTDRVQHDFKEYINKVQKGEPLDDLPIVILESRHHALVTVMKNRINFLQHSYNAVKNVNELYERVLKDIATKGIGLSGPQNFYLLGGGTMEANKYSAINSPQAAQGPNALTSGNTIDQSVRIGNTYREKEQQIEQLDRLIRMVEKLTTEETQSKENAVRSLSNVKDELKDEERPDASRIRRWLLKAKSCLGFLKLGGEVLQKAVEVYTSFDMPFS